MDLAGEWAATVRRLGGDADPVGAQGLGAQLMARYAEPHRRYHTLEHLAAVLRTCHELAPFADSPDIVSLAAWYHDAVYDPRRGDNEARSAELAEAGLRPAGVPLGTVDRVANLVRLTARHVASPGQRDAEVLFDADLAVLARPAPDYDRYAAAVRQEYGHLDDEAWRVGRAAVLRNLLAVPHLFRTPVAREWEAAARGNLSRELTALAAPSDGAGRPG